MPKLYKVSEIAEMLRVSERTVYNWIEWGYIRAIKVGEGKGSIRIPEEALAEFFETHQTIDKAIPSTKKLSF